MTIHDFSAGSTAVFSLILMCYALAGKLKLRGRIWLAACWALIAVGTILSGGTWARVLFAELVVTIYVLLIPILPWHRSPQSSEG